MPRSRQAVKEPKSTQKPLNQGRILEIQTANLSAGQGGYAEKQKKVMSN
jgi:hypothetical protein